MIPALLTLAAAGGFVEVPASTRQLTDPLSGIPVTVRVSPFALAKTETTQAEFTAVLGRNPSRRRAPALPVENVTWFDAIAYANAVSQRDQLPPCYDLATGRRTAGCTGYRLPTEAEWLAAGGAAAPPPTAVFHPASSAREATAGPADALGFHDLHGNLWEWCDDWFAANASPWPATDPRGPLRGLERVIRGGAFTTRNNNWSRGFRAGRNPEWGSPATGFRLARSLAPAPPPAPKQAAAFNVNAAWRDALAIPAAAPLEPRAHQVRTIETPWFDARLLALQTEPGSSEKILVLDGDPGSRHPRPVVIVPYYDVDTPAGIDLGGRNYQPLGVRSFAWLAAQQGWIAIAVRWFGESYGERYDEAVANLAERHPGATGLGKWVHDARRLLDWIETQPTMDRTRIGMIGHSLGGKMTLYAAAFDGRIQAAVASEPGISLKFSNYGDPWYWGPRLAALPPGADHDDLLRAIAPRPFLLIGGEDSDGEKSRPLLVKAGTGTFDFINHRQGHTPTPDAVGQAIRWLAKHLQ